MLRVSEKKSAEEDVGIKERHGRSGIVRGSIVVFAMSYECDQIKMKCGDMQTLHLFGVC